jgi:peptidoglycan lytic transglycosylase A
VPGESVRRLMVAQDTGGAIKGPVRGDLFWGTGNAAGSQAGMMNARGRYYLLLPRSIASRLAPGRLAVGERGAD